MSIIPNAAIHPIKVQGVNTLIVDVPIHDDNNEHVPHALCENSHRHAVPEESETRPIAREGATLTALLDSREGTTLTVNQIAT